MRAFKQHAFSNIKTPLDLKKYLLTFAFILLVAYTYAQPGTPIDNPVPLDGGIIALLVAGATYGAKRVYTKK